MKLRANARSIRAPIDSVLFRPGDCCNALPIVIHGTVKGQRIAKSVRLLVLYRIAAGQSCILTTACMISTEPYAAEGICETPVLAYAIPNECVHDLIEHSTAFRFWVFEGHGQRVAQLMSKVEEIACKRIDVRLAIRLLSLSGEQRSVRATQAALAADLATAREVAGRSLRDFTRAGWVRCCRGSTEILGRASLFGSAVR
jgi:CRP/FNR family transcriptional regulator, anaerobic regulatory protein